VIIVDELPRNTMGKVQKNILRQTYGPAPVRPV
jgi:acyl-coenzyme A synthetase/AMP-(fatty) acid ligase